MCVTKFSCILVVNQVYVTECVFIFSNFGCKMQFIFPVTLVVFGHYTSYREHLRTFENIYSKEPVSVTRKDILVHIINSFIQANDSAV